MNYYWLKQDMRYNRPPVIDNFSDIVDRRFMTLQNEGRIKDRNIVFSASQHKLDDLDVLDTQIFMVSTMIRKVFECYDNSIKFKFFCILNNACDQHLNYYAPVVREVDCISPKSDMNINRSCINKLVLRRQETEDYSIFKLANVNVNAILIRLDVAESILRRSPKGLMLVKAEFE